MKVTSMCKAVGKYKEQFKCTGLLLESVEGTETWVDIEGNLNYKDYKGKQVTVDIQRNSKGYWGGTFAGGQQSPAPPLQQASSQPRQSKKSEPNWDAIAEGKCRCAVICAAIQSNQINISGEMDVDQWVQYIMLGRNKVPQQAKPEPWDDAPSPTDDDIPW